MVFAATGAAILFTGGGAKVAYTGTGTCPLPVDDGAEDPEYDGYRPPPRAAPE